MHSSLARTPSEVGESKDSSSASKAVWSVSMPNSNATTIASDYSQRASYKRATPAGQATIRGKYRKQQERQREKLVKKVHDWMDMPDASPKATPPPTRATSPAASSNDTRRSSPGIDIRSLSVGNNSESGFQTKERVEARAARDKRLKIERQERAQKREEIRVQQPYNEMLASIRGLFRSAAPSTPSRQSSDARSAHSSSQHGRTTSSRRQASRGRSA